MVHEADGGGPLGRDAVAGQGVLLGQLEAGEQGPGDRSAVGGDQPDQHVGVGEVGASAMNTMSDRATMLHPSPTAGPFTAATTGSRHGIIR